MGGLHVKDGRSGLSRIKALLTLSLHNGDRAEVLVPDVKRGTECEGL